MVNKKVLCVYFKCCARQYNIYMLSKTVFQQVLNLNTPERRGNLPYSPLVSAGVVFSTTKKTINAKLWPEVV